MKTKFVLAVIAGSAVAFLTGWLIFGILFPQFYGSDLKPGALEITKKPPVMWAIAISNIAWVWLLTWVLRKTSNIGFRRGFIISLWISFLILVTYDTSTYAFFDMYELRFVVIDIITSTIFWAFIGGICGAILGTKNKKTEPAV
jgi:hypothetical protein